SSPLVIEAGLTHLRGETLVSLGAPGNPRLETFEVEQRPHGWVAVVHSQQEPYDLGHRVGVGPGTGRHVAVVVRLGLRDDPYRTGRQCPVLPEQQQVRVGEAGRIHLTGPQRPDRVAFAAYVVTVQADADVEMAQPDVAVRIDAGRAEVADREEGG